MILPILNIIRKFVNKYVHVSTYHWIFVKFIGYIRSIPFFYLNNVANADRAPPLPEGPIIKDSNLKAEVVFEGLSSPTSIAFVGPHDILVLEKDKGTAPENCKW